MQRRKLPAHQPTPSTREQRSAQDYTFEALHPVYFCDAWRVQPVLDAPESDLVLPPQPGLLVHGCWPRPSLTPDVLSVSDRDPEKEEHEVQEGQSLSSLAATDAAMADEDANEAVSVHSSSSESPTIPSTEQPEEDDAHMEDDDSANTSSAEEEGDCLSNRPALPDACPAQDENRRVVESGNGGCPGGTLVPFVDVRHFQFCTKRYRYHARIVQSFTCFTRALHAADHFLQ